MTPIRVSTDSSGALRGLARTADDHVVEDGRGPRDDVEVAVGDRVERAGIDRDVCSSHPPGGGRRSAPSRRSGARARMLAARRGPAAGRARSAWPRPGRPARGRGPEARARDEAARLRVRRVDDGDVERACRVGGGSAQPGEGLGADDRRPLGEPRPCEVRGDDCGRRRVALDEGGARGPARQRLDPGRAAAREQVEDTARPAGPARGSRTASA